jgi:hypothetical protein
MSEIFQDGCVLGGCAYSVFPGSIEMIDSGITTAFKRRISLNTFSCIGREHPNFEIIVNLANDTNDRDTVQTRLRNRKRRSL